MSHNKIGISSRLLSVFLLATLALAQKPAFKTAQAYAVGRSPVAVGLGDFNGDGILDLAVANQESNNVSVLLGKNEGIFQAAVNFDAGVSPNKIVVADINGDGKPDIAVLANVNLSISAPGRVSILLGNGDGTFQPALVLTLTLDQNPFTLIDLNGDKKADMIINLLDGSSNPSGVSISLGNGDGTFQSANTVPNAPSVVLVTDLNNDGKPDLAIETSSSSQLMYGNGDGTFSAGPNLIPSNGGTPGRIWVGDVNSDQQLDIILDSEYISGAHNDSSTEDIGAFLNNGGAFGNEKIFLTGILSKPVLFGGETDTLITDVLIGDFNGDGNVDVADRANTLNATNPPFAVNLGDGAGNFSVISLADPGPLAVAADLNGDQLTDLVVFDAANNNIAVLLNSTVTFTMTPATNTLTLAAGQQITDKLMFTSINGFSSDIQLSCQVVGPPPAPECVLSQTSIAAGSGNSTLTISGPPNRASLLPLEVPPARPPDFAFTFGIGVIALLSMVTRTRTATAKLSWHAVLLASMTLMCCSCGGGASSSKQSLQHYSVVVTAATSTFSRTLQISLTAP